MSSNIRRSALDSRARDVVELRVQVTREMADQLEAGVPCREVRLERQGEDRATLLLYASNREQWLLQVMAHAECAPLN